jgi:hypothetical protein
VPTVHGLENHDHRTQPAGQHFSNPGLPFFGDAHRLYRVNRAPAYGTAKVD